MDGAGEVRGTRRLELGKPIETTLAAGEVHVYTVDIASGQYMRVVAEQRGIDLVVILSEPDGKKLFEVDTPDNTQRPERVSLIAAASGNYRLEIRAAHKSTAGPYGIELQELREASAEDSQRIAATNAFAEGDRLCSVGDETSVRQAIEKYQLALSLSQKASDLEAEGEVLVAMGAAYGALSDSQKALDSIDKALAILRPLRTSRGEAEALNALGEIYVGMGQQRKALDAFAQALPLWRATGYRAGLAANLNDTGVVYNSWGEEQKALEYYREAAPLWKGLGDKRGEASTLTGIGIVEQELGEKQRALDALQQALVIVREIGELRGEAIILNNIGLVYDNLGDAAEALRYFLRSLPLKEKAGDPRLVAAALTSIGKAHSDLGEKEKALEDYTRALALSRTAKDPRGQAIALTRLGTLQESLGKNQKALDYHRQALELRRGLGDRTGVATILVRIGRIHSSLAETELGLACYREALPLARAVANPVLEAETLYGLAKAKREEGGLEEARQLIEDAIRLVESVRAKVVNPDLRASYFATVRELFEFYTDLLMRLHQQHPGEGFDSLALTATERARARSLLDLLAEARARIRHGADPVLLDRERSLSQLLGSKVERQARLASTGRSEEQAAEAAREVETLTAEYEQLESRIRAESPRYAALTQPRPLTPDEIQRDVLDDDTLLLEYALGSERSFVWAVTRTAIRSYELPRRLEIESAARSLSKQIQRPPANAGDVQKYRAESARLFEMVLGPVAGLLDTKKRLVIVSEGALQYVPFSVLVPPGTRASARRPAPLVATHEIVSLPSASTLAVLRRELAGREPAPKTLAVVADPVFEKDDVRLNRKAARPSRGQAPRLEVVAKPDESRQRDLVRSTRDLGLGEGNLRISRLPFTRREAEAILALVSPAERKVALDFDASRATATSGALSQYRFVHLATHGLLNSAHPALSGIVLSLVDRNARDQDGFLPAFEVFNLDLPADLVVLSACRTALGKEVLGEGLVGLTRAFMYAGAARVVASLWTVDDLATAKLMKRFYQGMLGRERLTPAAALRAAQIELSSQERWSHPYYWGAFVLQGDWK